jgi:hypothetical protein
MRTSVSPYHRHRFPDEIISHSVWLYFRFALSFRNVEEMLAMHGVALSYETIREWCLNSSSARFMLTTCDENLLGLGTSGILMKSSSRAMAAFAICGEQLIRIARFWIFWSKVNEIGEPPRSFPQTVEEIAVCPARDDQHPILSLCLGNTFFPQPKIGSDRINKGSVALRLPNQYVS